MLKGQAAQLFPHLAIIISRFRFPATLLLSITCTFFSLPLFQQILQCAELNDDDDYYKFDFLVRIWRNFWMLMIYLIMRRTTTVIHNSDDFPLFLYIDFPAIMTSDSWLFLEFVELWLSVMISSNEAYIVKCCVYICHRLTRFHQVHSANNCGFLFNWNCFG